MSHKLLCASVIGLVSLTASAARAQEAASGDAPTLEQLRGAVERLEGGRIERPSSYDTMTPEQQAYVKGILTGPRGAISGPLSVMMVSPGLGDVLQRAMAHARFAGREGFGSVTPKLNELGILMVARLWSAEYIWNAHARAGVRAGLGEDVVEAIRLGRRPARMEPDVEAIYNFADELLTKKRVSEATYQTAKATLGSDSGVVDLVGTMGLYQISSMMVVVDELAPAGAPSLPPIN
jgi:4-carboxymuconolactone decarboxylase